MKKTAIWFGISIAILALNFSCYSQPSRITFIEVFGNRQVSVDAVIKKAGIHEGDTISMAGFAGAQIITKIKTLPLVKQATIEPVCCEDSSGGWLVFIGVAESEHVYFKYHKNPAGAVVLTKEMTQTYNDFMNAVEKAVMSGNASEDYSSGYSIINDSACRRLQKKFIGYANNNLELLQKVIHESSDPKQREIAAWIIAYNDNKQKFIPDLLYAVSDSSEDVRNNATRALGILAGYAQTHPSLNIDIPADPFIAMIHSIVWTDRNKGSAVLEGLTRSRNKKLLISLKKNCLQELIEMARWTNKGHAYFSFVILGRMAEIPEEQIYKLLDNREVNLELIIRKIYSPKTFIHFAKAHPSISHLPHRPLSSL